MISFHMRHFHRSFQTISISNNSGASRRDHPFRDQVRQRTSGDSHFFAIDAIRFQSPWQNFSRNFEFCPKFHLSHRSYPFPGCVRRSGNSFLTLHIAGLLQCRRRSRPGSCVLKQWYRSAMSGRDSPLPARSKYSTKQNPAGELSRLFIPMILPLT
jgi:hypothetical protein